MICLNNKQSTLFNINVLAKLLNLLIKPLFKDLLNSLITTFGRQLSTSYHQLATTGHSLTILGTH